MTKKRGAGKSRDLSLKPGTQAACAADEPVVAWTYDRAQSRQMGVATKRCPSYCLRKCYSGWNSANDFNRAKPFCWLFSG